MLPERKIVKEVETHEYILPNSLSSFVMEYMQQAFYSWQDLEDAYRHFQPEGEELEMQPFYRFVKQHCQEKLSWLQIAYLRDSLSFTSNLKYLFIKSEPKQLQSQIEQLIAKQARRLKLKKENPVFYSFRTILLLLLSRCKKGKLPRSEFN